MTNTSRVKAKIIQWRPAIESKINELYVIAFFRY